MEPITGQRDLHQNDCPSFPQVRGENFIHQILADSLHNLVFSSDQFPVLLTPSSPTFPPEVLGEESGLLDVRDSGPDQWEGDNSSQNDTIIV